jgi:D-alanyl-D-alanine carboxypeptidase
MRLRIIFFTIILGAIVWGAIFFIFLNRYNREQPQPALTWQNSTRRAFLLPVTEASYLPIRDFNVPEPVLGAKAAALFDVRSGRFLYSKNMNQRLPIASIAKLMSAVVILENLDLNDVFTVPIENINVDGRGADFYKDEQLRGTDLFKIMLIKSSNDAALTFATAAQKKGIDFVAKMNEKAQAIGMFNTEFADPAGLNDQDTFSTASDLVKLVNCAGEYGLISQILRTESATVTSADGRTVHHLVNTNRLLGRIPNIIIGKTGYTDSALETMVLEVNINDGRDTIISVILGAEDRFAETEKLIRWVKTAYRWE